MTLTPTKPENGHDFRCQHRQHHHLHQQGSLFHRVPVRDRRSAGRHAARRSHLRPERCARRPSGGFSRRHPAGARRQHFGRHRCLPRHHRAGPGGRLGRRCRLLRRLTSPGAAGRPAWCGCGHRSSVASRPRASQPSSPRWRAGWRSAYRPGLRSTGSRTSSSRAVRRTVELSFVAVFPVTSVKRVKTEPSSSASPRAAATTTRAASAGLDSSERNPRTPDAAAGRSCSKVGWPTTVTTGRSTESSAGPAPLRGGVLLEEHGVEHDPARLLPPSPARTVRRSLPGLNRWCAQGWCACSNKHLPPFAGHVPVGNVRHPPL